LKDLFTSNNWLQCLNDDETTVGESDNCGRWEILHDRVVYENGTNWIDDCDEVHDSCSLHDADVKNQQYIPDPTIVSNNQVWKQKLENDSLNNSHQRTLIQFVAQWRC
jgi:hypothetical protein